MAGCSIVFLFCIFAPLVIICAALFLGVAFGSVLAAILSTIIYVYLTKTGFFVRYKESEEPLRRYAPGVIRIILLVVMVVSWLLTMGIAYLLTGGGR